MQISIIAIQISWCKTEAVGLVALYEGATAVEREIALSNLGVKTENSAGYSSCEL